MQCYGTTKIILKHQVLLCQRTRRNEVTNVNNVTGNLCAESPDVSEMYNNAIFVGVL